MVSEVDDQEIVSFYSPQIVQHVDQLSLAIDSLLQSVEERQPPSVFVGRSKLTILAAHKLVYIGDNIATVVHDQQCCREFRAASDGLCSVLRRVIQATKAAAERPTDVDAIKQMVDSVVGVAKVANGMRLVAESYIP